MTRAHFRTLSWATLVATLAVILWGAVVRATGSGAGCGSHWPTCNGEVLPRPQSVATVIELTHRITSGLSLLLVLAQLILAFRLFPKGHPVRRGASASMFFMCTEALVGAAIVLLKYVAFDKSVARAGWMSIHLVNTFLLVASITCTAYWASNHRARIRLRRRGITFVLIATSLVGCLLVGASGAVTALGDTLFTAPSLAQGIADDLSPTAHFLQQLRILHPIAAVLLAFFLLYGGRAVAARHPTPEVRRCSLVLRVLVISQLALGALNLYMLAPVWLQLLHLFLADLVWITLVLLSAAALRDDEAEEAIMAEKNASRGLVTSAG